MSRARDFSNITVNAYQGNPGPSPVQTFLNKFGSQPPFPPTTVPLTFVWALYGAGTATPNIQALVNVNTAGGPRPPLDKILSVRIDNLGNGVPVYAFFPDTGYTVVCPPNATAWENVETGQFSVNIIGEGFTDASALVGVTNVYLCNFKATPFTSYEFEQVASLFRASASISRGGTILNQNFGVPALGDQFIQPQVTVQNDGAVTQVFPVIQGFIYITSLVVTVNLSTSEAANGDALVVFESTGSAGEFMDFDVFMPLAQAGQVQPVLNGEIFSSGAVQWKIDGSQLWRIRAEAGGIGGISGVMRWNFTFTDNPN